MIVWQLAHHLKREAHTRDLPLSPIAAQTVPTGLSTVPLDRDPPNGDAKISGRRFKDPREHFFDSLFTHADALQHA